MSNKIARVAANHVPKPDARFPDATPASRALFLSMTKTLDRDGPAQRLADATRLSPDAFSSMIHKEYTDWLADIARKNAATSAAALAAADDETPSLFRRRRRHWTFAPA